MESELSIFKLSCNECRRRRVKCSRQIPQCDMCLKYSRHCLYEKHSKTPLTRKHLTEVEEELDLMRQFVRKCFPDIDISNLLQGVKNGVSVTEIPELTKYFNNKETMSSSENLENANLHRFSDRQGLMNPLNSTNIKTSITNYTPVDIQSLLSPQNDFNNGIYNNYSTNSPKSSLLDQNNLQIPQLLPTTIYRHKNTIDKNENTNFANSSKENRFNYFWDERNNGYVNEQSEIINGLATTDSSSYLGNSSSAALINLLGGGFFLSTRRAENFNSPVLERSSNMSLSSIPITREKREYYIEQYFELYHVSYPIIHKHLFMAHFSEIIPRPPNWDSLLYIVVAIGSFMSATSPEQNDDLILFEIAKSKLAIEYLETGNITLVQTLALMSNYLQKSDRPNSGYNYLGLAVRMALGLGLHKQMEDSEESLMNREIRKRVWWCLYVFDCGQTIGYGRPLGIPCAGMDVQLPLNIFDSELTALTVDLPEEVDQTTVFTSVGIQSLFHIFSNSIYERIISDPFPSARMLLEWDGAYLERWSTMIPAYFLPQNIPSKYKLAQLILQWRYKNFKIIMYRTFLLKKVVIYSKNIEECITDNSELRACEICLQECSSTIESMVEFWHLKKEFNRMDVWYTLFFLIPAALMPLVCLRNDPTSKSAECWRGDVMKSFDIIKSLLCICPSANKILDLFNALGSGYLISLSDSAQLYETGTDESAFHQISLLHKVLWPVSFDIEQFLALQDFNFNSNFNSNINSSSNSNSTV